VRRTYCGDAQLGGDNARPGEVARRVLGSEDTPADASAAGVRAARAGHANASRGFTRRWKRSCHRITMTAKSREIGAIRSSHAAKGRLGTNCWQAAGASVPIWKAGVPGGTAPTRVAGLRLADSLANGTLARRYEATGPVHSSPRPAPAAAPRSSPGRPRTPDEHRFRPEKAIFDPRACISVLRARLRRSIHSPLSNPPSAPRRCAWPARPNR
jgi:hypothetical protein